MKQMCLIWSGNHTEGEKPRRGGGEFLETNNYYSRRV